MTTTKYLETEAAVRHEIRVRGARPIGSETYYRNAEGIGGGFAVRSTDGGFEVVEMTSREIATHEWEILSVKARELDFAGDEYLVRAWKWKNEKTRESFRALAHSCFEQADQVRAQRDKAYATALELEINQLLNVHQDAAQ